MPVRLSVRMEQLGSQWKDFHDIWYMNISPSVQEVKVSLKSDNNNKTDVHLW
jgi:hypothetical protein